MVRTHDDRQLVVKILRVADVTEAKAQATHLMGVIRRIDNEHLVRQHSAIALADGTLALVLDEVAGGSLAHVLRGRRTLTPGEAITTIAPLFSALADLHAAGIVHGGLTPEKILFTEDGRPQMIGSGVAGLLGRSTGLGDEPSGFVAPELTEGADPSPASDVYAMAAIGWFCLTGAPPVPAAEGEGLTVESETPPRLVQVLSSCLCADPTARPSAGEVTAEVFDASRPEPVHLGSMSDPAAEITRRIRATAVSAPAIASRSTGQRYPSALIIGVVALFVVLALVGGSTWFLRLRHVAAQPVSDNQVAVLAAAQPSSTALMAEVPRAPSATSAPRITDVVTAPDSPRVAAADLLQSLVEARALAYAARDPALLDLVYAAGATKAVADRSNIATALKNGATYLGLRFVAKDVSFLDRTSDTARIRATIVTPAYRTGLSDGRKVAHQQEVVGPSVFTLELASDGWRILRMTAG